MQKVAHPPNDVSTNHLIPGGTSVSVHATPSANRANAVVFAGPAAHGGVVVVVVVLVAVVLVTVVVVETVVELVVVTVTVVFVFVVSVLVVCVSVVVDVYVAVVVVVVVAVAVIVVALVVVAVAVVVVTPFGSDILLSLCNCALKPSALTSKGASLLLTAAVAAILLAAFST